MKLKFGDIIIATATIIVLCVLISYPLTQLISLATSAYNAFEISGFIVFFLSPVITGYIYAKQIKEENRTKTILKIAVLVAFIAMFMVLLDDAVVEWAPYYKAEYLKTNPTATPTAYEWYNIQLAALTMETFAAAAVMLIFTFIGLYIGSMLKRTTKT
jgi:amino acid transporter